jgi:hypothetical protein
MEFRLGMEHPTDNLVVRGAMLIKKSYTIFIPGVLMAAR